MRNDALLVCVVMTYVAAGIACGAWAEPVLQEFVNDRFDWADLEQRLTLVRWGLAGLVAAWPLVIAAVVFMRVVQRLGRK